MNSAGAPPVNLGDGCRVRLGLIGDNIKRSRSPDLHRLAGRLTGLDVSYGLFIPRDLHGDFEHVFETCRTSGIRGVNITYPYKEQVVGKIEIDDPNVRQIGSANTVVFDGGRAFGFNTDHSGFIAAYRQTLGDAEPGRTIIIGAGGVGRAVAFGLAELGAELVVVDQNVAKAEILVAALLAAGFNRAVAGDSILNAAPTADGIANCTPLGMVGHPGSPVDASLLGNQRWAFEAVYTPVETAFKRAAQAAGLMVISGYELFFHQGVEAFRLFTGHAPDHTALRKLLIEAAAGSQAA